MEEKIKKIKEKVMSRATSIEEAIFLCFCALTDEGIKIKRFSLKRTKVTFYTQESVTKTGKKEGKFIFFVEFYNGQSGVVMTLKELIYKEEIKKPLFNSLPLGFMEIEYFAKPDRVDLQHISRGIFRVTDAISISSVTLTHSVDIETKDGFSTDMPGTKVSFSNGEAIYAIGELHWHIAKRAFDI